MKHILQPTIEYEYIPDQDQTDWPMFDSLDRIEHKNLITYSIVNNFTARRPATGKNGPAYAYINFLRLELLQSFDFTQEDEEDGRPFSDISAELDFTPGQYVSLDADAAWSPYDSEFTSHNVLLSLWDARGDRLNVDYRYARKPDDTAQDTIKSISLSGQMVLNNRWLARGSYEYNFYTNETIASQIGLSYQSQCWAVDLDYRTEEDDHSISAMLTLLGLGSVGSK
jgi:LPS-assembly protein